VRQDLDAVPGQDEGDQPATHDMPVDEADFDLDATQWQMGPELGKGWWLQLHPLLGLGIPDGFLRLGERRQVGCGGGVRHTVSGQLTSAASCASSTRLVL